MDKLQIIYETPALTVCVKPAGVDCERGMPQLLREHWGSPDAYVGVVHRLDVPTEGVMVFARTPHAAAELSRQIAARELKKEYLCTCAGVPEPPEGEMRDFLFKDRAGKVFPVKSARRGAKEAVLRYRVEEAADDGSAVCRVFLDTGRTHQIRVQFASRKHPLHGDGKYGSRVKGALALRCVKLTFTPPGETAARTFTLE